MCLPPVHNCVPEACQKRLEPLMWEQSIILSFGQLHNGLSSKTDAFRHVIKLVFKWKNDLCSTVVNTLAFSSSLMILCRSFSFHRTVCAPLLRRTPLKMSKYSNELDKTRVAFPIRCIVFSDF